MKNAVVLKFIAGIALPMLVVAGPTFAQSASESMHEAGESSKNAASSAGHAVVHAYHGTATAVKDTTITAKVKTALHDDKVTKGADIHVKTTDGVVTLRGNVASSRIAEHAERLAHQTTGVKGVENKLNVGTASSGAE
jgi:hyperosmotically inducible periplasmic protein